MVMMIGQNYKLPPEPGKYDNVDMIMMTDAMKRLFNQLSEPTGDGYSRRTKKTTIVSDSPRINTGFGGPFERYQRKQ